MSEMTEFYQYYDDGVEIGCGFGERQGDFVNNLMQCQDETIINLCEDIKIPKDYEYKSLCKNILDYYRKYKKLSDIQRYALCCLIFAKVNDFKESF